VSTAQALLGPHHTLCYHPQESRKNLFFVEPNRRQLCDIAAMLDAGQLRPVVGTMLPFAQAAAAYTPEPMRNRRPGKTVVTLIPPS
jgi:NADPH:quinone reductase-like Zn-dependent oxidoreductase